jgi:hypothetical protein
MPMDKDDVEHYTDLFRVYKRRLQELEKQQAHYGSDCPTYITLEIGNVSERISQIKDILGDLGISSAENYIHTTIKIPEDKFLAFDNQEIIYRYLCAYVEENGAKRATLIQYSGRRATPLLWTLLQKGANVVMYVQNPKVAISQRQKHRIKSTIKEMPDEIRLNDEARLRIFLYDAPSSFRGVSIDNKILAIGGYLYEHRNDELFPNDKVAISGHDAPGLLLREGSQWHEIYNKMFNDMATNYKRYLRSIKRKATLDTARKRKQH